MMLRTVAMVGVALFWSAPCFAGFKLDATETMIQKSQNILSLNDLAISETGIITGAEFCSTDGELYVMKAAELQPSASTMEFSGG